MFFNQDTSKLLALIVVIHENIIFAFYRLPQKHQGLWWWFEFCFQKYRYVYNGQKRKWIVTSLETASETEIAQHKTVCLW